MQAPLSLPLFSPLPLPVQVLQKYQSGKINGKPKLIIKLLVCKINNATKDWEGVLGHQGPPVCVCIFISVVALEYPDRSNLEEEGAYSNSQLQVKSTVMGGPGRNFKRLVTLPPQPRADRMYTGQASCLLLLQSVALLFHSPGPHA